MLNAKITLFFLVFSLASFAIDDLTGTWSGYYTETEYVTGDEYIGACTFRNTGTLKFVITQSGSSFSGTAQDSGSGTVTSGECESISGGYSYSGTVSGSISGNQISATMILGDSQVSFTLPFSGTVSGDSMEATYSGSSSDGNTYSGSFNLNKISSTSSQTTTPSTGGVPITGSVPIISPVEKLPEGKVQPETITSARSDLDKVLPLHKVVKDLQAKITIEVTAGRVDALPKLRDDLKFKSEQLDNLELKVEEKYKEMLKVDPNNFWVNWDMAELRKSQGDYRGFFDYFDSAASNKNIFENTRNELKKKAAQDLGISEFPTVTRSNIVRTIINEMTEWQGGQLYNVVVPKDAAADRQTWYMKLYTIFSPKSHSVVNDIVGMPENK